MAIRDYRPQTTAPGPVRVRELGAPDTRGIQQLGGAISDLGATLENARQEVEINDARLALTEGLGALNADLTKDTDFATMRTRYGERLGELEKSVMGSISTPKLKGRMGLEFAQSKIAAEARVYARENELGGSHARATASRVIRETANAVPNAATPEEGEVAYQRGLDTIDSLLKADHITAEEAEAMRVQLDGDISTGLVLGAINSDPRAAATALREPGAFALDETERQRYLATAERAAEQTETVKKSVLEREVDTARGVLVRGGIVAPEDIARLRTEATGTDYAPKLEGAILASQQLGNFYGATDAERTKLIEETRAKGISVDDATVDGAFLSSLEAIDAAARTELETDPVTYAMKAGLPGAGPLDLSDQKSVNQRMALIGVLAKDYGADGFVLTKEERDHFKGVANDGTVDEQLAFVVSTIDGFGPGASAVFQEIDGLDPVVRRAGELVFETNSTETAKIILAGRKAMAAGDELLVPGEDALAVFEEAIDGTLGSQPGRREEVIEAAKAYYAAKAPGRAKLTDLTSQTDLLGEAVQAVLGGRTVKGTLYGGVQDVNGLRVKLPASMDRTSASSLLSSATDDNWKAASLSGNLPHEGDDPVNPGGGEPVLMWVEGSTYRLGVRSRRGEVEWYQDPATSNGFFYVDLDKLAGDFKKRPPKPTEPPATRGGRAAGLGGE
jgi:hypothetical protein